MATLEQRQAFYDACQQHDWTHAYSDDGRVSRRGEAEEKRLRAIAKQDPELLAIFEAWGNHVFRRDEFPTKPARPA